MRASWLVSATRSSTSSHHVHSRRSAPIASAERPSRFCAARAFSAASGPSPSARAIAASAPAKSELRRMWARGPIRASAARAASALPPRRARWIAESTSSGSNRLPAARPLRRPGPIGRRGDDPACRPPVPAVGVVVVEQIGGRQRHLLLQLGRGRRAGDRRLRLGHERRRPGAGRVRRDEQIGPAGEGGVALGRRAAAQQEQEHTTVGPHRPDPERDQVGDRDEDIQSAGGEHRRAPPALDRHLAGGEQEQDAEPHVGERTGQQHPAVDADPGGGRQVAVREEHQPAGDPVPRAEANAGTPIGDVEQERADGDPLQPQPLGQPRRRRARSRAGRRRASARGRRRAASRRPSRETPRRSLPRTMRRSRGGSSPRR